MRFVITLGDMGISLNSRQNLIDFYKRRNMSEPNLFVTTLHKGLGMHRKSPRIKGKRKPMKSKPVIRVGGRKVSAAPRNKTKYRFPVEISYVGDTNR